MKKYPKFISIFMSFLILIIFITGAMAQEVETFICSDCKYENDPGYKFCVSCGESLSDEYTQWEIGKQGEDRYGKRFISERVDPPRLFSVPTARVLGSMDIRLTGGGAFGVATDQSFLGKVGIGLGNIAEVEFSTVGMVTNMTRGSTVFPTSAFKLMLIPENRWHIPTLAVAMRSSANWQDVRSDKRVLEANGLGSFNDEASKQVSRIDYDTRFTTVYAVTTVRLWFLSLHAGASLTDVRVKELSVDYYILDPHSEPEEKQKNLIGGFAGFDIESNSRTKLMFEVRTVSNYEYNTETRKIDVTEAYLAIGGVRFFFWRWLSTDVGVWYQSTFKGIADMQIKMSLNVFIPGGSIGNKFRLFRRNSTQ